MAYSDREIMEFVLAGRIEFFDQLVRRHRPAMLRAAQSKLRNSARAEDAVQDSFLAAFAHRHTFNPEFSFRGWVWTILLNVCRKGLAADARKNPQRSSDSASISEPFTTDTGLTELLKAERSELLAELLGQLSEVEADALRLRFFGELQFDEIAQVMNCSLGGAKTRVRRGLERLAALARRDSLCAHDGEDL